MGLAPMLCRGQLSPDVGEQHPQSPQVGQVSSSAQVRSEETNNPRQFTDATDSMRDSPPYASLEFSKGGAMIRGCLLIVADGTQASGKTTFLYGLASALKEHGHHVGLLPEPARSSPLVDDVVRYGNGTFDMPLEVDLFAAHLRQVARATRTCDVILADRCPLNVVIYSRVLSVAHSAEDAKLLNSMEAMASQWHEYVDLTILLRDKFSQHGQGDEMRRLVLHTQDQMDLALDSAYRRWPARLQRMPTGLSTHERVAHALPRITQLIEGSLK